MAKNRVYIQDIFENREVKLTSPVSQVYVRGRSQFDWAIEYLGMNSHGVGDLAFFTLIDRPN